MGTVDQSCDATGFVKREDGGGAAGAKGDRGAGKECLTRDDIWRLRVWGNDLAVDSDLGRGVGGQGR